MSYSAVFGSPNSYFGNIVLGLDQSGSGTSSGSCTLFIEGLSTPCSGDMTLCITGSESASGNAPLYIAGVGSASGSVPLYISTDTFTTGNLNLSIFGPGTTSKTGTCNLFLNGGTTGNSGIYNSLPLYISNFPTAASGAMNLYVGGLSSGGGSGSLNLSISGPSTFTAGDIPLYVQNNGSSSSIPLHTIAGGFIDPTADTSPVVAGSGTGSLNLFIGRSDAGEILPLFLQGPYNDASGNLPLYLNGGVSSSGSVPFYVYGFDTPSGILPLKIAGY